MFQHLCQMQQNTSIMSNQVVQNIAVLDNKIGSVLPVPSNLPSVSSPPSALASPVCEPDLRPAELFNSNTDLCAGFLLQCNLAFAQSPSLFPTNSAKITYVVNALKGRAFRWAQAFFVVSFP